MVRFMRTVFFIVAAAGWGASALAQKADPAVYGALPDITDVRISPDGSTIAFLRTIGGDRAVVFFELDNPDAQPEGLSLGDVDARGIEWANNDKLLLEISQSREVSASSGMETMEFFRWIALSKSEMKSRPLTMTETGYFIGDGGSLLSILPDDPDNVLMARTSLAGQSRATQPSRFSKEPEPVYSLFRVDIDNVRWRRVETGNEHTHDWLINADGEAVARVDYDRDKAERRIYARPEGQSNFKLIKTFEEAPGDDPVIWLYGLTDNPNRAYGLASVDGVRTLVEFDLASGEISKAPLQASDYGFSSTVYDERKATITGVRYTDDMPRTRYLSEADQALQEKLEKAMPDAAVMIRSRSADNSRAVVQALYTNRPSRYFLYDNGAGTLTMIAATYEALDGTIVANKEQYDYVAPDGLAIPGYVTTPADAPKASMPLIVMPHGGPEARSDQVFDTFTFFFAANGYLVYEPNYRGSEGYGDAFRMAGHGEWGRAMQDDITNGVKKLIADGLVDPDRICIVGGSYGGYAALAGATLTPDLYACAISINGVSNLIGMLGTASGRGLAEDYWKVRIGDRFRNEEELNAVSPSEIADQAGAPILLIHAKDDIVVPIAQSLRMRDALERAGKPHDYVELDGEDHWLSTGEMRTEVLSRSIEFIDEAIGAE